MLNFKEIFRKYYGGHITTYYLIIIGTIRAKYSSANDNQLE